MSTITTPWSRNETPRSTEHPQPSGGLVTYASEDARRLGQVGSRAHPPCGGSQRVAALLGTNRAANSRRGRERRDTAVRYETCKVADMENALTTETGQSIREKVNHRVDDVTTSAGQSARDAAERVREADLTERTADKLESVGDYLERADYDQLVEDMTGVVKRHPIPAVLAGVGIGYLIGRLTS